MKLKILGTRGEIDVSAPYHARHSGLLVDDRILIDIGEPEFLDEDPRYVLLTHLHPDHAYFVRKQERRLLPAGIQIFAPETHDDYPAVKALSRARDFDGYRIRPIPTIHSKHVKSQGYLIGKDETRVLYTGDMVWIEKRHQRHLEDLDAVVADGSFLRKGGMVRRDAETGLIYGHNGVPDLVRLFSRFTNRIIFTHFGTWLYGDTKKSARRVRAIGTQYGVDARISYDGMLVRI